MTEATDKPDSKGMRALKISWAALLIAGVVFSLLMAAWGDLREALMLKVLDDRHSKSFTLQVPEGAKVWLGEEYLGPGAVHELAIDDPDYVLDVEGMSVQLPRVYFVEEQLLENAVGADESQSVQALIKKLAPEHDVVWSASATVIEAGFMPVLLADEMGLLDFVLLGRIDFPNHDTDWTRAAFLLRFEWKDSRVLLPVKTRVFSDQLWPDEGGFWARREEFEGFPPELQGQTKTIWQFCLEAPEDEKAWLNERVPEKYRDAQWARLPAEEK